MISWIVQMGRKPSASTATGGRSLMFRAVGMDGTDRHSQIFIQMLFHTDSAFGFALKLS